MNDVASPFCDGVLIVYAAGDGQCEYGHGCNVNELRWADHDAYLAAHHRLTKPEDQSRSEPR